MTFLQAVQLSVSFRGIFAWILAPDPNDLGPTLLLPAHSNIKAVKYLISQSEKQLSFMHFCLW